MIVDYRYVVDEFDKFLGILYEIKGKSEWHEMEKLYNPANNIKNIF